MIQVCGAFSADVVELIQTLVRVQTNATVRGLYVSVIHFFSHVSILIFSCFLF